MHREVSESRSDISLIDFWSVGGAGVRWTPLRQQKHRPNRQVRPPLPTKYHLGLIVPRMKRIEAKAGERSSPLRDMIVFFTVVKHKKERRPRRSAVKQ